MNVSEILEFAMKKEHEIAESETENMVLAALGHDLYEDTEADRQEVIKLFGPNVHEYISHLTNPRQDVGTIDEYMQNLLNGPEEAILIKFADVIDNTIDTAYSLHEIEYKWSSEVFTPHIQSVYTELKKYKAIKYPRINKYLMNLADFSLERLTSNLKKYDI